MARHRGRAAVFVIVDATPPPARRRDGAGHVRQRGIELPLRVAKLFLRLALMARALNAMSERGKS